MDKKEKKEDLLFQWICRNAVWKTCCLRLHGSYLLSSTLKMDEACSFRMVLYTSETATCTDQRNTLKVKVR